MVAGQEEAGGVISEWAARNEEKFTGRQRRVAEMEITRAAEHTDISHIVDMPMGRCEHVCNATGEGPASDRVVC